MPMTRHLEQIVHELLRMLGGWMFGLGMCLLGAVLVAAFLGLNLYKHDRDSFRLALEGVLRTLSRGWAWALVGAVLLAQIFGLSTLHKSVTEHLDQQSRAQYGQANDAGGGPTVQRAPSVAFLETTERAQRIVIPPALMNMIPTTGVNGLPGWTPEEARYNGSPAIKVEDELVKDDNAVVINRKTTVQRFVPLKLARSDVQVKLEFQDRRLGQKRQFYKADFSGRYTFQNPFSEKRRLHFTFPLPQNSGTLDNFKFRVDGRELPPQDIAQGMQFEGDIEPAATTVIDVSYSNVGAQSWTYDVAGRREAIADFHLQVQADKGDIKFLRGALYPTRTEKDGSGVKLLWDLQNQVTSQSVSLFFPTVSQDELVNRLYVFCPLALLAFVSSALTWSRLRRSGTTAWSMVLVTAIWCTGAALTAYLLDLLPFALAIAVGFGSAAALQLMVLGTRLWLPVAAALLVPFAFLSPTSPGLLLSILGMALLAATAWETRRCATPSGA